MSRTVTDEDLNAFADLVEAKNQIMVVKMIKDHKRECDPQNEIKFVTQKEFNTNQQKCKKGIYNRINDVERDILLKPVPKSNGNGKKLDDVTVKFSFGGHVRENWWKYAVLAISVVILALLGYPMLPMG